MEKGNCIGGIKALSEDIVSKVVCGKIKTKEELAREKARLAEKYALNRFPKNSEILEHVSEGDYDLMLPLLQKKPTRTLSGVAVIAAMTKPHDCPHGKCIYCPGGLEAEVPQSYTGKEPATRRAIMNDYDPYKQVHARLEQLDKIGHPIDKCELITMGGTLPSQPYAYQEYFVRECLRAMNDYPETKEDYGTLEEIQSANEKSSVRCVGMTFETRPDYATQKEVDVMLKLGGTKVELGVQTLDDKIYEKVDRGHNIEDVSDATQTCKDSLLKVGYQMMPGLFSDQKKDLEIFKELFDDPRFKPDLLKFYPCLVLKGTKLYDLWKKGEYKPYTTEEAAELIAKIKSFVPPWTRIIRIQRDIPVDLVVDGVIKSNLRELVGDKMREHKTFCRCIRCREIGIKMSKEKIAPDPDAIRLKRIDYDASGGKEVFLSFEDETNDLLIGFLRLRRPSPSANRPELEDCAGIRELHVYGPMVEIGEQAKERWQHRGYGRELIAEAERIAKEEWDLEKIAVISGIGVRNYYRKFGYERDGVYMGKII